MNRLTDTPQCLGRNKIHIWGSFAPNGGSALDQTAVRKGGGGFSVLYISTGLYRITLEDAFVTLLTHTATLMANTALARFLQFGPYDATNKTIDLRSVDGSGVVQDIAANANNRIGFDLVFDDAMQQ